jgi:hypothetical protein
MLVIILAEDEAFYRSVSHRSRLMGHSVIRYRDAVKLADNLPELKPDFVIVRVMDFPLHWELLAAELAFLRIPSHPRLIAFVQKGSPMPPSLDGTVFLADGFSAADRDSAFTAFPEELEKVMSCKDDAFDAPRHTFRTKSLLQKLSIHSTMTNYEQRPDFHV